MRIILLGCFILLFSSHLFAQSYEQKENNIWLGVGYNGNQVPGNTIGTQGMDFNSGSPQQVPPFAPMGIAGGSSSVCDRNGNLLFYTNGNIIWNRNGQVMDHGFDINNNGTLNNWYILSYMPGAPYLAQPASSDDYYGVVAVPMPGNRHKYYLFCVKKYWWMDPSGLSAATTWEGKLRYSIIDMDLNNGLGDVDTTHRGIAIADSMAQGICAIPGDDCNIWLLSYHLPTFEYRAYNITEHGIDTTPIVSSLGANNFSDVGGQMVVSPNRKKVVETFITNVEVSDFNPATGQFSNLTNININWCESAAFSPDNSKLYLSFADNVPLHQYDITQPSPWNPTLLSLPTLNNIYDGFYIPLRLGPNKKIYLTGYSFDTVNYSGYLAFGSVINQPDLAGNAAQLAFIPGNLLHMLTMDFLYEFPSVIPVITYDTITATIAAPLCFRDTETHLIPTDTNGTDYHWMADTVGSNFYLVAADSVHQLSIHNPGTYIASYYTSGPCTFHLDTFVVRHTSFSLSLGRDRLSCFGQPMTLVTGLTDAQFLWSDGSTGYQAIAPTSGTYWVQATKDGCTASDTIVVHVENITQNLGNDTLLCIEAKATLNLKANTEPGWNVLWSDGTTGPLLNANDSGLYWVSVRDGDCIGTDSINITERYCICPVLVPNAFSPNGDGLNDKFSPVIPDGCIIRNFKLLVYNRWGQLVFSGFKAEGGWDGWYKGAPADVGTYMYRLEMKLGEDQQDIIQKGDFLLVR